MSEPRRSVGTFATLAAGVIIGAVEAVLAIAFAAFVFGGLLVNRLPDGIGLYLVAAALTLAILAWRAGRRGVVGSVQDAAAAVLAVVAATTAAKAAEIAKVAQATGLDGLRGTRRLPHRHRRDAGHHDPLRDRVRGARDLPARQPRPVRAVPGRRRLPRRHRMAPAERRPLRRLGSGGPSADDRAHAPRGRAHPLAPRLRVRRGPARGRPGGQEAAGHPRRARGRTRHVRDRHGRHRFVDRHGAGWRVAPRAVRVDAAVATLEPSRPRRGRLVGGPRTVDGHRHRRPRGRHRDPVQHQRDRDRRCTGTSTRTGSSGTPASSTSSPAHSAGSPGTTRSA